MSVGCVWWGVCVWCMVCDVCDVCGLGLGVWYMCAVCDLWCFFRNVCGVCLVWLMSVICLMCDVILCVICDGWCLCNCVIYVWRVCYVCDVCGVYVWYVWCVWCDAHLRRFRGKGSTLRPLHPLPPLSVSSFMYLSTCITFRHLSTRSRVFDQVFCWYFPPRYFPYSLVRSFHTLNIQWNYVTNVAGKCAQKTPNLRRISELLLTNNLSSVSDLSHHIRLT